MANTNGISAHDGANEAQPLLGGRKPPMKSLWKRARGTMLVDITRDWADLALLSCYIITGLLDSSSNSIWGSFVSMQTGNTVYIGLGFAAPSESNRWIKSLVSVGFFCLGSVFFSNLHNRLSPRRRAILVLSFFLQTSLIVAGAAIVTTTKPASKEDIGWEVLVPIALVAFQSCGQAVASRALKYNSLTSVVLTSIYTDLFSDTQLFALHNAERNRRVAAPLLLLAGAVGGGLFAHSEVGIAGALWTAAVLKMGVVIAWLFWPADKEEEL